MFAVLDADLGIFFGPRLSSRADLSVKSSHEPARLKKAQSANPNLSAFLGAASRVASHGAPTCC